MTPLDETVRASRFEVTDTDGNVRAVFGRLDPGSGPSEAYGISLLDGNGAERAALTLDEHGPSLVFVQHGNIAVHIGVDDPLLPDDHRGAFVVVADENGAPMARLWLATDGTLRVETGV